MLAAFEHAEDDRFLARAASAFAAHPPRSEEGFVDFDLAGEGRMLLAFVSDGAPHGQEDRVDRTHAQAGQLSGVGGGQIQRPTAHEGPKTGLADFRTAVVPVFLLHFRKIAALWGSFAS